MHNAWCSNCQWTGLLLLSSKPKGVMDWTQIWLKSGFKVNVSVRTVSSLASTKKISFIGSWSWRTWVMTSGHLNRASALCLPNSPTHPVLQYCERKMRRSLLGSTFWSAHPATLLLICRPLYRPLGGDVNFSGTSVSKLKFYRGSWQQTHCIDPRGL